MKRRIRKRRQIRLFNLISKKAAMRLNPYEYEEELWDETLQKHSFYNYSENSNFVFFYVDYRAPITKPKRIVFLLDQLSHRIDYDCITINSNDDLEIKSDKRGHLYLIENISFDKMINCYPRYLIRSYDASFYCIFMKRKQRKRYLGVDAIYHKSSYYPFKWLFDLFDEIAKSIPIELCVDLSEIHG